jgi:poly(A) polymerase
MAAPGSAPGSGHLGVTGPLSTALPTEAELQASTALVDELKRQNNYESVTETNKRFVPDHPPKPSSALPSLDK